MNIEAQLENPYNPLQFAKFWKINSNIRMIFKISLPNFTSVNLQIIYFSQDGREFPTCFKAPCQKTLLSQQTRYYMWERHKVSCWYKTTSTVSEYSIKKISLQVSNQVNRSINKRSFHVIKFSGRQLDWGRWSKKFKAQATIEVESLYS